MITRDVLASQLRNYLQHRMTRAELVDWAERAMDDRVIDGAIADEFMQVVKKMIENWVPADAQGRAIALSSVACGL